MNCSVSKEKVQITKFVRKTSELQRLQGKGPKNKIGKNKVRITMLLRKRSELQGL